MDLKTLRSHRIFGISLFDLLVSMIGTIALFIWCWWKHFNTLYIWRFILAAIILTIPIGIVIHIIFGINTHLNYTLGLSKKP